MWEADCKRVVYAFRNVEAYLKAKKRRKAEPSQGNRVGISPLSWKIPEVIPASKRDNIDNRPIGRAKSLVLIGKSRTGKTAWAESWKILL